ncbi:MAG: hypothetical protein MI741_12445, partial [Rhodospirillales bacterium]|nr:hypothetical protein [Rhodospirillales bacterium]
MARLFHAREALSHSPSFCRYSMDLAGHTIRSPAPVQALCFDGKSPVLENHRETPAPSPGEVLIHPLRMGICSTDIELCEGYMGFEGVLGHEFV